MSGKVKGKGGAYAPQVQTRAAKKAAAAKHGKDDVADGSAEGKGPDSGDHGAGGGVGAPAAADEHVDDAGGSASGSGSGDDEGGDVSPSTSTHGKRKPSGKKKADCAGASGLPQASLYTALKRPAVPSLKTLDPSTVLKFLKEEDAYQKQLVAERRAPVPLHDLLSEELQFMAHGLLETYGETIADDYEEYQAWLAVIPDEADYDPEQFEEWSVLMRRILRCVAEEVPDSLQFVPMSEIKKSFVKDVVWPPVTQPVKYHLDLLRFKTAFQRWVARSGYADEVQASTDSVKSCINWLVEAVRPEAFRDKFVRPRLRHCKYEMVTDFFDLIGELSQSYLSCVVLLTSSPSGGGDKVKSPSSFKSDARGARGRRTFGGGSAGAGDGAKSSGDRVATPTAPSPSAESASGSKRGCLKCGGGHHVKVCPVASEEEKLRLISELRMRIDAKNAPSGTSSGGAGTGKTHSSVKARVGLVTASVAPEMPSGIAPALGEHGGIVCGASVLRMTLDTGAELSCLTMQSVEMLKLHYDVEVKPLVRQVTITAPLGIPEPSTHALKCTNLQWLKPDGVTCCIPSLTAVILPPSSVLPNSLIVGNPDIKLVPGATEVLVNALGAPGTSSQCALVGRIMADDGARILGEADADPHDFSVEAEFVDVTDKVLVSVSQSTPDELLSAVQSLASTARDNARASGIATEAEAQRLYDVIMRHAAVFRLGLDGSPPIAVPPVHISLKPGFRDLRIRPRHFTREKSAFLDEMFALLESWGYVTRVPHAPFAIAPIPVKKQGVPESAPLLKRYRLAFDGSPLKDYIENMCSTIPILAHFPEVLNGFVVGGVMDMDAAFWQFAVDEESSQLIHVQTTTAIYRVHRLLQGLQPSADVCSGSVRHILGPDLVNKHAWCYMDEVGLKGNSVSQYIDVVEVCLGRFLEHNVRLSASKCDFFTRRISFAGRVYTPSGWSFNPRYLEPLVSMPRPADAAQLQQFLAFLNYLRDAVPAYASLVAPLQDLLTKVVDGKSRKASVLRHVSLVGNGWAAEHDEAFAKVIAAVTRVVCLALPDDSKDLCLITDASDQFWAGVITMVPPEQMCLPLQDRSHMPLLFMSGAFRGSSLNWSICDKEAAAIVFSCAKAEYLLCRERPFSVYTDHKNLKSILDPSSSGTGKLHQSEARMLRWKLFLRSFKYTLHVIPGELNIADSFTRWMVSLSTGPTSVPLVQSPASASVCVVTRRAAAAASGSSESMPQSTADGTEARLSATTLSELLQLDPSEFPSIEEIAGAQQRVIGDGVLPPVGVSQDPEDKVYRSGAGLVWVPAARMLRLRIFIVAHQSSGAGHRGTDVTLGYIQQYFTWPGLQADVVAMVAACIHCVRVKGGKVQPRPLAHMARASAPNQILHSDFYYVLPLHPDASHSYVYVLVLMDGFSKLTSLTPCASADSSVVVHAMLQWSAYFGIPAQLSTDQGSHFASKVVDELSHRLGIKQHLTVAYAPWSNGMVERRCKTVSEILRLLLSEARAPPHEWPAILPLVQSVLNNTPSAAIAGMAPVQVHTGLPARNPLSVIFRPDARDFISVDVTSDFVKAHVAKLQAVMIERHSQVSGVLPRGHVTRPGEKPVDFAIGDWVLVSRQHGNERDKTLPPWWGPARVVDTVSDLVYKVQDVNSDKVYVVHARHLRFYWDASLVVTDKLKDVAAYGAHGSAIVMLVDHDLSATPPTVCVQWEAGPTSWEPLRTIVQDAPQVVRSYIASLPASQRPAVQAQVEKLKKK